MKYGKWCFRESQDDDDGRCVEIDVPLMQVPMLMEGQCREFLACGLAGNEWQRVRSDRCWTRLLGWFTLAHWNCPFRCTRAGDE